MPVRFSAFLCFLVALLLQLTSSALLASLSSYQTLVNTNYVLNMTFTSTSIPAATQPNIRLSTRFLVDSSTITNCAFATTSASTYSTGACSASTNSTAVTIVFTDAYPSILSGQTKLSLKLTIDNPWAATSQSVSLFLLSGSTTVASSFTTISYSASALSSCSWSSSSNVNGVASTRTVTFTPSAKVMSGSILSISLPFWFGSLLNLAVSTPVCSGLTNIDGLLTCTNSTGGSYETLTVSNLFSSNKTVTGAVSLSLSSVYNPWSTYPFGPITFSLIYAPSGTEYVSQSCTGITQTTTTSNSMNSFGISFFSFISFSSNFKNGWFKITNPLPASGGELHISWTGGVSISCTAGSSPSLISLNSSLLVLGNFSSDYFPNSNISIFTRFNVVAPPSSRTFTITASTFYVSGSTAYPIDTKTNSYNCLAGTFSPASVVLSSYSIGASTTLTLSLTLGHAVYANSYIGVTLPSNLAVSGSCSSNSSLLTCSVTNSSYSNVSVSGTVAAQTVIILTFSVTNPGEAITTSSLQVISYIDYLFDGIIDSTTSGLTITLGANQLADNSFFAQPTNATTQTTTSYTLSATLLDPIPAGGKIMLVFPSAITLTAPAVSSASFSTTTCTLSTTGNNITLSNCFSASMTNLNFYVIISGITNPVSLAPTTSFSIYTYGASSIINFKETGTTVTMTTLVLSSAFTITPSSTVVDATSAYTFTLTFHGSPASGDYLLLTLPAGMSVPGTPSCSPTAGIALLTCTAPSSSELKVTFVAVPASSITFTVNSIKNYQISSSVSLKMVVYASTNYATEQTSSVSLSFTSATLTVSTNHDDQLALNYPSNITLTVTAPFTLDSTLNGSLTSLRIALPSGVTTLSNSTCSASSLSCSLSGTTFIVSSAGLSVSGLAVKLSNLMLGFTTTSASFSVQYLYSTSLVASLSAGITVSIFCTSPCQQCLTSASTCLSCLPAPNTLILYYSPNNTCLSSCPITYFQQGTSCVTCMTSCSTCNSSTTCISCASNFYFYNNTCVNPCPNGTYLSGSDCLACDSTCLTCSSSSTHCLTCSTSTLFHNNTCLASCPSGNYNSSGTCVACTTNCLTCSSTNCSACSSSYFLHLGVCYSTCPASAPVPDTTTQTCSVCASTCSNCSTDGSQCYTCISGYLILNGQCYTSCPEGYEVTLTDSSTCSAIKYVSTFYYPTAITTGSLLLFVLLSKLISPATSLVGNSAALLSAGAFASTIMLTSSCFSDQSLPGRLLAIQPAYTTLFSIGIAIVCCSILLAITYVVYLNFKFDCDAGLKLWRQKSRTNKYVLNVVVVMACLRVGLLRIAYCRLFGRQCFSCYVRANGYFLKITNFFTIASLIFCSAAGIGFSLLFLLNNLGSSQTRIYALDLAILCALQAVALILDMCLRSKQHFKQIIQSFPYLRKFRKYQDLQSSDGSLISIQEPQDVRCKTQAEPGPTALPVGGFGAFSQAPSQASDPSVIVKTLPEINNLQVEVQFDPYQQKRKSDELFFQERQYTKKFNQLKQSYQPEEEVSPPEQQYAENEAAKSIQQIIKEKIQGKTSSKTVEQIINEKPREVDPANFLQQISPEDYRPVNQQQALFLDTVAKKKGVDPALLRQLFGVRKHYNQKLLSETLDHQEVPSEAVKNLINPQNDQVTIQNIFGRDSTVEAHKLQAVLSDPNNQELVNALFGKESGLFTLETIKTLLNQFSINFLKNLLSAEQVDRQKLKTLMQSCRQHEGQEEGLNALQKIGGKDLEEHNIVRNTMGKNAQLNPKLVPKIAAEMSKDSIKNIFSKQTSCTSTMVRKVINNKHIPLQGLNPIQQIPQIVEQFAQLLHCQDENVEKGLISMLEEGNYDGEALKILVQQAGENQEQMGRLLTYIDQNRERLTPVQNWPTTPENHIDNLSQEESINYLDFDKELETKENMHQFKNPPKKVQVDNVQVKVEDIYDDQESDIPDQNPFEWKRSNTKTRVRRKDLPEVHLPSEHIYLQRLPGTRNIQKRKTIRTKKKPQKQAEKFMDEENEIYDLDF